VVLDVAGRLNGVALRKQGSGNLGASNVARVIGAKAGAAVFVGERRWNLRLKDGLDIRLPENDVGNALATLSKLDKDDRLFSRDIVAVDMRLPDRLTVQLSEDAAKAREELFNKKLKKKAGDA